MAGLRSGGTEKVRLQRLSATSAPPAPAEQLRRAVLLRTAANDFYARGDAASLARARNAGAESVEVMRALLSSLGGGGSTATRSVSASGGGLLSLARSLVGGATCTASDVTRELISAETVLGTVLCESGELSSAVAAYAQAHCLANAALRECSARGATAAEFRAERMRLAQISHDGAVSMEAFAGALAYAEAQAARRPKKVVERKPLAPPEVLAGLRAKWSTLGAVLRGAADAERGGRTGPDLSLDSAEAAVAPALRCAEEAERAAICESGFAALWTLAPSALWKPLRRLDSAVRRRTRRADKAHADAVDDKQLFRDVRRGFADAEKANATDQAQLERVRKAVDDASRAAWDAAVRELTDLEDGQDAAPEAVKKATKALHHAQKHATLRRAEASKYDVGQIVKTASRSERRLATAVGERDRAAAINAAAVAIEVAFRAAAAASASVRDSALWLLRPAPAAWRCAELLYQRARSLYRDEMESDATAAEAERALGRAEASIRREAARMRREAALEARQKFVQDRDATAAHKAKEAKKRERAAAKAALEVPEGDKRVDELKQFDDVVARNERAAALAEVDALAEAKAEARRVKKAANAAARAAKTEAEAAEGDEEADGDDGVDVAPATAAKGGEGDENNAGGGSDGAAAAAVDEEEEEESSVDEAAEASERQRLLDLAGAALQERAAKALGLNEKGRKPKPRRRSPRRRVDAPRPPMPQVFLTLGAEAPLRPSAARIDLALTMLCLAQCLRKVAQRLPKTSANEHLQRTRAYAKAKRYANAAREHFHALFEYALNVDHDGPTAGSWQDQSIVAAKLVKWLTTDVEEAALAASAAAGHDASAAAAAQRGDSSSGEEEEETGSGGEEEGGGAAAASPASSSDSEEMVEDGEGTVAAAGNGVEGAKEAAASAVVAGAAGDGRDGGEPLNAQGGAEEEVRLPLPPVTSSPRKRRGSLCLEATPAAALAWLERKLGRRRGGVRRLVAIVNHAPSTEAGCATEVLQTQAVHFLRLSRGRAHVAGHTLASALLSLNTSPAVHSAEGSSNSRTRADRCCTELIAGGQHVAALEILRTFGFVGRDRERERERVDGEAESSDGLSARICYDGGGAGRSAATSAQGSASATLRSPAARSTLHVTKRDYLVAALRARCNFLDFVVGMTALDLARGGVGPIASARRAALLQL